jgi:hypothetical protein
MQSIPWIQDRATSNYPRRMTSNWTQEIDDLDPRETAIDHRIRVVGEWTITMFKESVTTDDTYGCFYLCVVAVH